MKHHLLFVLALSSCLLSSYRYKNRTYQTECFSVETDGFIAVKIWDTKRGVKYKPERAKKDAVHAVLYSGIAAGNSCSTQPPILNTQDEQDKFSKIIKRFFSRRGAWALFTRSSISEVTSSSLVNNSNCKVYQVFISKNNLRKYLEDQNVIKSINHGF